MKKSIIFYILITLCTWSKTLSRLKISMHSGQKTGPRSKTGTFIEHVLYSGWKHLEPWDILLWSLVECHPLTQTSSLCISTGVTVYAAVCSVCDTQSSWLNAVLSECTDGQVHAHLPGTVSNIMQALSSTFMLRCPSSQMHGKRDRNSCKYPLLVYRLVLYTNPMCLGGKWSVCVLCTHRPLLHRWGKAGPQPG